MELRLPLEMSPGREAACRAVFGTWGFFRTMHGKTAPSCSLHSQAGVRRGVRASGSYQEGTGKSGSYGMWNHPRGHVWNVLVLLIVVDADCAGKPHAADGFLRDVHAPRAAAAVAGAAGAGWRGRTRPQAPGGDFRGATAAGGDCAGDGQ